MVSADRRGFLLAIEDHNDVVLVLASWQELQKLLDALLLEARRLFEGFFEV